MPDGRIVKMKLDTTIINDCMKVFGGVINGSYVIPGRFIITE